MRDRLSLRIGIAVFALLMAAPSPVRADYRSAVSAYENGAYEAALGEFRTLAQSGDSAAQYQLGLMFRDGRGVRKDPVTALGWFICAAGSDGQDGADAARSAEQLSSTLDRASVSAAQERARDCRATAEKHALAQSGDPAAQYQLGLMFEDGRGVRKDPVTALGWFICAAGSGGQDGADAARSAEQLSSTLDRASVSAAQERARNCRTLAENALRPDTSEPSERPDSGNRFSWEDLKTKLDQFIEALSRIEIAGPDGDASADRTAASEPPKFGARSTVAVPDRRSVWSRAFFFPADGTLVGSQHVAWKLGATDLYRDLRRIARNNNKIALGLFAVLWWLLIGKTLLSMGGVLMRVLRRPGQE